MIPQHPRYLSDSAIRTHWAEQYAKFASASKKSKSVRHAYLSFIWTEAASRGIHISFPERDVLGEVRRVYVSKDDMIAGKIELLRLHHKEPEAFAKIRKLAAADFDLHPLFVEE